ncbi:hypothetical protein [Sphingomonas sp. Leaf226]|uniref:hypothetical protein n=1 Tax=Sphingomonas sp. Leaf226 TaxID=1735691 RepID=UPI000B2BC9F3|nr:hypothetical protein [Sphingomonas sp. Leaf226]
MAVLTNIPNNTSARDWRDTMNSLIKRIAALEAAGVPVATPAPAFTTQPSITPTSGTAGSTVYAATPGTVSNGSVVSRAWLLNGTAISTGVTALPASSGTLAYQETASGPGGTTTSTVQVAAVTAATVTPTPAPSFISQPSISPNTGTAGATTFTATAGNVSNGSITARSWTINGTVISTGIAASPASSGTLTYQETATGPGGTTQSTVQQVTVATAAAAAPAFTTQPTVSPSTGTAGTTTYTATPGAVSNGSITSRAWSLNGSVISTGLTAAPASAGTLTYQEFATGTGGTASSSTLTRTVSAAAAPSLSLSSAVVKAEGNSGTTVFAWTLTLNRDGSTAAYPFSWSTAGSGANPANSADFGGAFPTGSGTFAAGETSKTISVLVAGDTAVEPDDTFTLTVVAAGLNTVTSTGTITNDDTAPIDPNLPASIQIVPEGDSLTAYTNTNGRPGWADQAVTGLIAGPTYMYRKVAQGGETAQAMDADFDSGVAPAAIAPGSGSVGSVGTKVGAGPAYDPSYAMNIMMLGPVGTNDDISQNSFAVYKAIRRIVMKSYAKGYARTLVSTLIPRNGVAGGDGTDTYAGHNYDADNIQINRDIAALWDSDIGADYLIDFATIWPKQTDYSVPDQSADGTHQSGTGFDKMAIPARAGLNYVIQNVGVKRMEPLTWTPWDGRAELTLSGDSRTVTASSNSAGYFRYGYPNLRSGKWYFEIDPLTGTTTSIGIGTRGNKLYSTGATIISATNSFVEVTQQGVVSIAGVATPVAQLGTRAVGDVICFALDADNHRLWIRRNSLDWNGNSDAVVSTDPALQAGYIDLAPLRAYDLTMAGRTAAYSPYIRSYAPMTAVTRFAASENVRHRPGNFQALDLGAAKVAAVTPTNLTVPVISGEAIVGKTLTASGDTWDNSPSSYTNEWTRDGVVVSGRTGRTYAVTSADVGKRIGYSRTPVNSAGTGVAAVAVPTYAALNTTSPWNPSILGTKLVAWWKPSEAAITGTGTATRWSDEQGNASLTNQGLSGTVPAPTYSAAARNGTPGAQFGGTGSLASNTAEKNFPYPAYAPIVSSFIAVSGYAPAGSAERVAFYLGDGVATRGYGIGVDAAGLIEMAGGNATAFKPASAKTWSDQDRMVSIGYAGSGTAATMTIDGVSEALTITNRTGGTARYRLGSDVNGTGSSRYFNGIIQNIYLISPMPSLAEQQKLEGYDSWITGKAGANLPSDHPYKSRAPLAGDA